MRWSKPLRLHLSVLVATLLLCISIPLIWMAFSHGREAAIVAGEKQMRQMSLRLVEGYKYALAGGYEAVAVASTLQHIASRPPLELEEKQAFFLEVLRNVPNATSMLAGYPDGSYIQAINAANPYVRTALSAPDGTAFAIRIVAHENAGKIEIMRFLDSGGRFIGERRSEGTTFDARQRPWYRSVLQHQKPVSVGPFVSGTLKVPTLTIAAPMKDNGQIAVGVNIHLETVSRLLDAREISPRARSYILDEQDGLVAHSDPAMMSRILGLWTQRGEADDGAAKTLDRTVDTVIRLRRDAKLTKGELARFDLDGEPYLVEIAPVTFSDLFKGTSVAVVVPFHDLVSQANRQLARNVMMAAIFVIAGVGASIVLARLISASLYQLAAEARKIGDLDFAGKGTSPSWISEINTLEGALAASRRAIAQFALYVPREVVRRIVDPADTSTKAARQDVTVLFTDIRDFTTISEQHPPEDVVEILSAYFELLNQIAERHHGTVVQYLGDSIFVMWNAPIRDADHVASGCRCALAMSVAVDELNERNREIGRPELRTRFGLHTGQAVVGSFGAIARQQYTAMGDTINVASRLEGLNKEFGTTILASAAIQHVVADEFAFRPLGLMKVKGRMEAVEVYELVQARPRQPG